jgi:mannose-6-phosphate isomerase-like protein (cupin superfamily)
MAASVAEPRTYTNPRTGAWLRPLEAGGDAAMERLMKPHTGKANAHVHLDFDERYEILEGTATIVVDGRTRTAGPGETVEVARGTKHRNPFNDTGQDVRLRHTVSPRSEFTDCFISALGHHTERDTVNAQGEFPDLQLFVILDATQAKSYLAGPPIFVQKPVIAAMASIGRRRGYRPRYD